MYMYIFLPYRYQLFGRDKETLILPTVTHDECVRWVMRVLHPKSDERRVLAVHVEARIHEDLTELEAEPDLEDERGEQLSPGSPSESRARAATQRRLQHLLDEVREWRDRLPFVEQLEGDCRKLW